MIRPEFTRTEEETKRRILEKVGEANISDEEIIKKNISDKDEIDFLKKHFNYLEYYLDDMDYPITITFKKNILTAKKKYSLRRKAVEKAALVA